MFTFALSFLLSVVRVPVEYVIDGSSWPGTTKTTLKLEFESEDGKVIRNKFSFFPDTDPSAVQLGLKLFVRDGGWKYDLIGKDTVVVRGSQTSPVKRVSIESTGWSPTVTAVPIGPAKIVLPEPPKKK